jgi:hypothetical protein
MLVGEMGDTAYGEKTPLLAVDNSVKVDTRRLSCLVRATGMRGRSSPVWRIGGGGSGLSLRPYAAAATDTSAPGPAPAAAPGPAHTRPLSIGLLPAAYERGPAAGPPCLLKGATIRWTLADPLYLNRRKAIIPRIIIKPTTSSQSHPNTPENIVRS